MEKRLKTIHPARRNNRWPWTLASVITVVLTAVISLQFHQSSLLSNTLRYEEDNIAWNFFQLDRNLMQLQLTLQKALLSPESVDPEQLQLRFDIFLNQTQTVKKGTAIKILSQYSDYGNLEAMEQVTEFLSVFQHYFAEDGAARMDAAAFREMLQHIEQLRTPVHDQSLFATQMMDKRAGDTSTKIKQQIAISTGLILFECTLVLLFSWIMFRQMRQLDNRAHALTEALDQADHSYAQVASYMRAIDQHALVAVTDLNGVMTHVNDKLCAVAGYTREELLGRHLSALPADRHSESFYAEGWEVARRGEIWRAEICHHAKEGSLFWVDSALVPIKDGNGKPIRYLSVRIDITDRKHAEQRISYLATHDKLTGLPNRDLLQDRMQQALAHSRRTQERMAVYFIDLDDFKHVNDSLGHDAGDLLLQEVARRLSATVRAEDTVTRQGGDEFIVLLSQISGPQDAEVVAVKLLAALATAFHIRDRELYISASIGIAMYPEDGNDVETLLQHSDTAMYHAKTSGRNNYQFFAPALNEKTRERQIITADLRQALARAEFHLVFQPVVDIRTGAITGLEALLRWNHPTKGPISPVQFIPIAEETGIIIAIGDWVLLSVCHQIRAWLADGFQVPRVAINLSAKQLRDQKIGHRIAEILSDTGVDARYLGLEITESMLVENVEEVAETLSCLNAIGLEISIDDFGTGYSSLSYLKRFPVNKLKIDRSFVTDITTDHDDEMIVRAVIAMAHGMQMTVVAEGVESRDQLDFLSSNQCDYYQGYYFSRPVSAGEIRRQLRPVEREMQLPVSV